MGHFWKFVHALMILATPVQGTWYAAFSCTFAFRVCVQQCVSAHVHAIAHQTMVNCFMLC